MQNESDDSKSTLDKPDDDSALEHENELLAGLPDDPAERAKELETRLEAQARETEHGRKENERLARERDEQKERGDFWFSKDKESRDRVPSPRADSADGGEKKRSLPKVDLAEVVADEDGGYDRLANRLKEDLGLVTRDELQAERSKEREATARGRAIQQQLTDEYPDLSDLKSPLCKEAGTQFLQLEQEHPDWDTTAIAELAVSRAARRIGYQAPKGGEPANDRARSAFASGGRKTNGNGGKGVTDEIRNTVAKAVKGLGDEISPERLKRIQETVAANQAAARALQR